MSTLCPNWLKRLTRDRDGATIMEFAVVVPLLFTLLVGIMEVSRVTLAMSLMEGGLREASRFGITGLDSETGTREDQIIALINEHGAGLFVIDQSHLTTLIYPNFGAIGQPEPFVDANGNGVYDPGEAFTDINCNSQWDPDMGRAGLGFGGEVVLYTIDYDLPLMTKLIAPLIGNDGEIDLDASVAVRNEPFEQGDPEC